MDDSIHCRKTAREALWGHGAMLVFAALIAGAFSIGKMAAPHIDPAALTALRFVLAATVMGFVLFLVGQRLEVRFWAAPWRYAVLGALMGGYFVLMFEALKTAQPVSTSALFTLIPAMSAIFGWVLLRQRTTPWATGALGVGAVGAAWVIFRGDVDAMLSLRIGPGETIFFFGCICHALYTPMVKRLNRGEPVLVYTFGTIVGALVVVGIYAVPAVVGTDWPGLPGIVWFTVAYLAIFTTAGTFALLQFAALRIDAGKVMAYGYLTPAFVALYEGALGHGWPRASILVGVVLIVSALAILLLEPGEERDRASGRDGLNPP